MPSNPKKSKTRKGVTPVTHQAPLTEGAIKVLFPVSKPVLRGLRSKPIATNKHTSPYIVMLKESGLNRNFVLRFQQVNVRNYNSFLREPERFLTVPDMCVVHSVTGVSIDRQIHLLLFGLSEYELTRKGSRLIGSLSDLVRSTVSTEA